MYWLFEGLTAQKEGKERKGKTAHLRSFDQLDPDGTVDRVEDEAGPLAGGVVLPTVLTDCLKGLEQCLFHHLPRLLDLIRTGCSETTSH